MFMETTYKRFRLAFYFLCLFCIIPCDWDGKKMRLTPTKYLLRNILNCFLAYAVPVGFTAASIMFAFDIHFERLDIGQTCIIAVFLGAGHIMGLMSVLSRRFVHDCTFIVNNVLKLDSMYKGLDLDKKITQDQLKREPQLVLIGSNVIEILATAYTISLPFLFAEDFDPFRRYVYNVLLFFAPSLGGSFLFTCFAVFIYAGMVRICFSYVVFLAYFLTMFVQFHHYWKAVLYESCKVQSASPTEFPSADLQKIFHTTYAFGKIFVDSGFSYGFLPYLVAMFFILCVTASVGCVKLFGVLSLGIYFLLPSAAILTPVIAGMLWLSIADAQNMANEVLRQWQNKLPRTPGEIYFVKQAKCCRALVGVIGPYFDMSRTNFVAFLEQIGDKVITLLLY